jgi:Cu/Ag efflux protein CusF
MTRWLVVGSGVVPVALLVAGLSFGQSKPADCKAQAPEKVEGQVVSVDPQAGKVTVKEKNGTTHVFQASPETLQGMKPGDSIEAKLREAPKC